MNRVGVFLASVAVASGACKYGDWTEWTACSEPCSGGVKSRYKTGTGDTCEPSFVEMPCNTQQCTPPTIDAFDNHLEFLPSAGLQKLFLSGISTGGDLEQALTLDAYATNESVVSNIRIRYQSPESTGEVSYNIVGVGQTVLRVMVIDSGSTSKGPQFGGSEVKIVVKAPKVMCAHNQYARAGECIPCLAGTSHVGEHDANDGDSDCTVEQCAENERVLNSRCVPCLPGESHSHGAAATNGDTECEAIICGENMHVVSNKCVRCTAGKRRAAGDMANSYNTFCEEVNCNFNEYLKANECTPCPKGLTSHGGSSTECIETVCKEGEHAKDFTCQRCPEGHTHEGGQVAAEGDTDCELIECRENENFDGQTCVSCPPGHEHAGRASVFDDSDCTLQVCGPNEEHDGQSCVVCPPGAHAPGGHVVGDDHSGCSTLVCAENEKVQSNTCVSCPAGHATGGGHSADGLDTDCAILVCPPGEKVADNDCVSCAIGHEHEENSDPSVQDGCAAALKVACGAADAIFVVDMSGSIGAAAFVKMKEYVKAIGAALDISENGVHAALVSFATEAKTEFDFDSGNNLKLFNRAIDALQYSPGKDTRIDLGLGSAAKILAAHSEADTSKIVFVFTDGRQTGGGSSLAAAVAPIVSLGADIVVIGIGEEVDPNELALLTHSEEDVLLGNVGNLVAQVEELAIMVCMGLGEHGDSNSNGNGGSTPAIGGGDGDGHGDDGHDDPSPDSGSGSTGTCERLSGSQCRAARGQCDWCRFMGTCAERGECPGGQLRNRRSIALPPADSLGLCQCTDSGPRWSDVSEAHFCWLQDTPCNGVKEIVAREWADCTDVHCPASMPWEERQYTPPRDTFPFVFNNRQCYGMKSQQCRGQAECSWCPVFKGCAPNKQCKSLHKGKGGKRKGGKRKGGKRKGGKAKGKATPQPTPMPTPLPTPLSDVYEYAYADGSFDEQCTRTGSLLVCEDGRVYEIDSNGLQWPKTEAAEATPAVPFMTALSSVMKETVGAETDPASGTHCLSTQNFCTSAEFAYCCKWQQDLVHFYKYLTENLGPQLNPETGGRCTSLPDACAVEGEAYCCEWQTGLLALYGL